jgi:glucosamine--fructose-6-phosphate aminotransferase (isomerizing)
MPSLVTRYKAGPDLSRALVIALSQSGQSEDVVETTAAARRNGALTLALTNSPRSPLAHAAEFCLFCHAGKEHSVAATKTYTAQLYLLALLSAAMRDRESCWQALEQVPEAIRQTLSLRAQVTELAARLRYLTHTAVIARGYCHGNCFELALKLTELTYVVSLPYSSADFRHGPIAMIEPGFCVLMLAPRGKVASDLAELAQALRDRDAELITISDLKRINQLATCALPLPVSVPEWLAPLTTIIPGQLLAMEVARAKRLPLDKPRHLLKVTRTR